MMTIDAADYCALLDGKAHLEDLLAEHRLLVSEKDAEYRALEEALAAAEAKVTAHEDRIRVMGHQIEAFAVLYLEKTRYSQTTKEPHD